MSSAGASAEATQDDALRNAVIRLAGNSQDGIQSVGGMLGRLAGRTAQEVMTYMTIPSTISGGPSIFQVRRHLPILTSRLWHGWLIERSACYRVPVQ